MVWDTDLSTTISGSRATDGSSLAGLTSAPCTLGGKVAPHDAPRGSYPAVSPGSFQG